MGNPAPPDPARQLEALVPRPNLIGRGDPFPPRTQVMAVEFGTFLSLHSERLVVRKDGQVAEEVPLFRLSELVVGARGVALSSDLIRELCERGVRVLFLEDTGTPYAMLSSPMLTATVRTRREQMAALEDDRGVRFARAIVAGKIQNQANLLKYFGKYLALADRDRFEELRRLIEEIQKLLPAVAGSRRRPAPMAGDGAADGDPMFGGEATPPSAEERPSAAVPRGESATAAVAGPVGMRPAAAGGIGRSSSPAVERRAAPTVRRKDGGEDGETVDRIRGALLAVEGAAGRLYWRGIRLLLGEEKFAGRRHRGADDPVNAALNYGYGILYGKVWAALSVAGLEPFAGFLHVDRPGKPSLVLDAVEEYRQAVVDRTVVGIFTRGIAVKLENGRLDTPSRREIARRVLERLETPVPYEGRKAALRAVIQAQAHHLATALRGERRYRPYRFRW